MACVFSCVLWYQSTCSDEVAALNQPACAYLLKFLNGCFKFARHSQPPCNVCRIKHQQLPQLTP